MSEFSKRWTKSIISGGNPLVFRDLLSIPAISSSDGQHSLICLSHQLRVYFLQTRLCINTIDIDLTKAKAVHLDPDSDHRIVVFTEKSIMYVNWREKLDNPVVARQTISPALSGLRCVIKATSSSYYVATQTHLTLQVHSIDRESATATKLFEHENVRNFAISSNGYKLAVVMKTGFVALLDISAVLNELSTKSDLKSITATVRATQEDFSTQFKSVTCLAVADSGIIAIGNTGGIINLIYAGSSTGKSERTLRWHVDPVNCLCFSADENYLVSGGSEKVLVFWHLGLDRTQFLPRFSGPIDCIQVDKHRPDHYTVALRVMEGPHNQTAHEILSVLLIDLISRLSVNPVRPNYASSINRAVEVSRKNSFGAKRVFKNLSCDVSAPMTVHPTTNHLYFPRGSAIQAYDIVRGEQAFVQHAVSQIPIGRVKSERMVADASISILCFTTDGKWMATFDSMPTLDFDNLMLKKDVAYALKFWQWKDSQWLLTLKIVDPHGPGMEVGVISSPGGHSFTSVDKHGGIRVWKPRANHVGAIASKCTTTPSHKTVTQTVWTLRRASPPTTKPGTVAICYSPDRSILAVSHGYDVKVHDPELLHELDFSLVAMDLPVESLLIIGSFLIIAAQRKIVLFDLVSGDVTELCVQSGIMGITNLIAVDVSKQLIAIAINQYKDQPEVVLRSRILIFSPVSTEPLYTTDHPLAIASLSYSPTGFIFIDTNCRIGVVAPEIKLSVTQLAAEDLSAQMSKMLVSAQATANVLFARSKDQSVSTKVGDTSSKWTAHKMIDVAALQPVFSNIEGVSLDSLFEKVARVVQ